MKTRHKSRLRVAGTCFMLTAACSVAAPPPASAKNIFDDEVIPSTRPAEPEPIKPATQPTAPTVTAPKLVEPLPAAPKPLPEPTEHPERPAAPAGRRPIPSREAQAKSRALMSEVFADAMKDHTPTGKHKLVASLMASLPKMGDGTPDEFLLLSGTLNAAQEASDLSDVIYAADTLAGHFDVDGMSLKLRTATSMSLRADSPAVDAANMKAGLRLLKQLTDADNLTDAARIGSILRPAASRDPAMQALLQKQVAEIDSKRLAHDRILPQIAALQKNPDDPSACTAVGNYYCLQNNDWSRGLPLLARGSDPDLKKRAAGEIDANAKPDDLLAAADAWWTASAKQLEPIRVRMQGHAVSLYERGLEQATGLRRATIEKRISEAKLAEAPGSPAVKADLARLKTRWEAADRLMSPTPAPFSNPAAPLAGDIIWRPNADGFSCSGSVQIGNSNNNHGGSWSASKVHAEPGYSLQGGTLVVSGGSLELAGTRDKPILLKDVHIVCEYTALVKALNTVFDHCVFEKGGGYYWNDGNSSKWEMQGCLFHDSNFKGLSRMDYGIKLRGCVFVDCSLPDRHWGYRNNESVNDDAAAMAHQSWSEISDCDFYRCQLAVSSVWLFQRCNLFLCTIGKAETFQSRTPLAVDLGVSPEDFQTIDDLQSRTTSPGAGAVSYHRSAALFPRK